jgi:hypothetical protein
MSGAALEQQGEQVRRNARTEAGGPTDDLQPMDVADTADVRTGVEQRPNGLGRTQAGREVKRRRVVAGIPAVGSAPCSKSRRTASTWATASCSPVAPPSGVRSRASAGSSASSSRKVATSPASQAAKNAVTAGIRRRSTSAFRARQLGKPWSRATASWASANLARGSERRSSTRTSFARFLRWSSEGRCGSSDFDMATRPSVEWPGVRGSRAGSQGWLSVQSVG